MPKPIKKPTLVQVPASFEAFKAPAMSPASYLLFTCDEKTIPTIPKGKQQKIVTKIDSTSQFLGRGAGNDESG